MAELTEAQYAALGRMLVEVLTPDDMYCHLDTRHPACITLDGTAYIDDDFAELLAEAIGQPVGVEAPAKSWTPPMTGCPSCGVPMRPAVRGTAECIRCNIVVNLI